MLNRFIPILAAFVLTAFTIAAQEPAEKLVPLHVSDNTDLVHFRQGDYVFSFSRADLLQPYANYDWLNKCTEILTVGDTFDLYTVGEQFLAFDRESDAEDIPLFKETFDQCLKDGLVRIHSTVSGRDLATVRYTENGQNSITKKNYRWLIEEPVSHQPIFGYVRYRCTVNPSF